MVSPDEDRARRIAETAADEAVDPRTRFSAPGHVATETNASYEDRLTILQRWRARLEESEASEREAVIAAIKSLEAGAVLGTDEPDDAPNKWGYGMVRRE